MDINTGIRIGTRPAVAADVVAFFNQKNPPIQVVGKPLRQYGAVKASAHNNDGFRRRMNGFFSHATFCLLSNPQNVNAAGQWRG
jgi:hypothetical protein